MLQILLVLAMIIPNSDSIYNYRVKTIDGEVVDLSTFKGKRMLLVNTASKCGFTKQYKDLQALHEQHGEDLVIIGFPSDNFGGQELDANDEIQAFCEQNYGVTFLLSEKIDVKGAQSAPLFKYLTEADNPDFTGDINWNFEKFLIDGEGQLIHRYRSKVSPSDPEFVKAALGK